MTRVTPPQSARQQRHLAFVSEFTTDLRHTPGSDNLVADALSRPPPVLGVPPAGLPVLSIPPASLPSEPPRQTTLQVPAADAQPIDFLELSFAQPSCSDVQAMLVSPSLSVVSKKVGAVEVLGDVSTGVFRPLLPARFRSASVLSLHNIHHPGVRATRRLVCSSFCWPKMGVFVAALTSNCLHCQKGKIHRHVSLQAAHIPVPVRRFSHIHVDLVGPLPSSSGFSYLFAVVDRTTRWPEAIPLASTTAADYAAALLQGWIQRFGVPNIITSDRGPQFTSSLWASLCSLLNISHTQTTAYHPQSNGLVERFHRRLKDALRARGAGADWFRTFLGYCWVSGQLGERTLNFPHQRRFLVHSWFCLVSSSLLLSRRHRLFFENSKGFWQIAHLFRLRITPLQLPHLSQRICCWLGLFWFAMTASSRRCRRCTTVRSWFSRGLYISSSFSWVQGLKLFPHIDSSLVTLLKIYRPPNRRAEVVRKTPSSHQ
jgi:hypothetical protein